MKVDIVLAGVGGQGILTIARVLSSAALAKGLNVKQAEVHGMSQRGGAVYSHVRISDREIYSDLIPTGRADMVLSVEPLEALRYAPMLAENGTIVSSTNAMANISNYPPMEAVLEHIARHPNHIALDMERLSRAAGSPMAANIAALGAASLLLSFSAHDLEAAIERIMGAKGERVLTANLKAFRFGRAAATAYLEGMRRGANPVLLRSWIETLSADHLAGEFNLDAEAMEILESDPTKLSGAEAHAFESLLREAYDEGRRQLYEHEVYSLIELVGAISPPKYTFVPKGAAISPGVLETYPGSQVVVKLVSQDVVHKSEAGAVAFVPKTQSAVQGEIDRMICRHAGATVAGTLVVEFVEPSARGLGSELFVGIRATQHFGPVIAAGLGGVETEYMASRMRPGFAVAKAPAMDTTPEAFMELFKQTAAYEILSGSVRGHERLVSDGELLRCFRAFIFIARHFCVDRGEDGPDIGELEVNPFAFVGHRLVPLDGRGRLKPAAKPRQRRPMEKLQALIEPKSIAMVGVSSKEEGVGRIILGGLLRAGFDAGQIQLVTKNPAHVRSVDSVAALDPVDLLILATPAETIAGLVAEANAGQKAKACIVISGGEVGQIETGEDRMIVLGPNCMGVRSLPGKVDTFFIPEDKLASPDRSLPCAIISQSGAFVVSRLSSMGGISPSIAISLGNQCDATVSDLLWALDEREDLKAVGVYLEGFADLDGLETVRAVTSWTSKGKSVVFYKAGRTEAGKNAAAGHTTAVAGDYEIAQTALEQAGAMIAESFRDFSQLLEVSTLLERPKGGEGRIFAVTNAGMEAVGMADAISAHDLLRFVPPSAGLAEQLRECLSANHLERLVSISNPIDLTPMAKEAAYDAIVRAACASSEVDLVVVSCVPLAPGLRTLAPDLGDPRAFPALAQEWKSWGKPIVFVLDSGSRFDALAAAVRSRGVPVFRAADEAIRMASTWTRAQYRGRVAHAASESVNIESCETALAHR